jgi:hypothetical protein
MNSGRFIRIMGYRRRFYLSILCGFGVVIVYYSILLAKLGPCGQNGCYWVVVEFLV